MRRPKIVELGFHGYDRVIGVILCLDHIFTSNMWFKFQFKCYVMIHED